MRTRLRARFYVALFASAIVLSRPAALFADPVKITPGFLSVGGAGFSTVIRSSQSFIASGPTLVTWPSAHH